MKNSLHLAGAAALCAALLLSACAKRTTEQTTTQTSTDTTQSTSATTSAPAAASSAPDAAATSTPAAGEASAASGANGTSGGGFIDLPVYPGAADNTDQGMTMSSNGGSFTVKVYSTKDDAKKVAEWYKSHLPAEFKGGVLTSGDKTVGTFSDEHAGGDQSVVVANEPDGTTRIQLSTKHGK